MKYLLLLLIGSTAIAVEPGNATISFTRLSNGQTQILIEYDEHFFEIDPVHSDKCPCITSTQSQYSR